MLKIWILISVKIALPQITELYVLIQNCLRVGILLKKKIKKKII